ncbi:D-alanyl-D-alanine carboxypeptidase [Actinocrinis puniceicyclus]|uniref:D-alanyl-D-alanine carboxypeptidase n=1 Tax=Actinocrinis puniceicyclus TaxID=977794 RepID=A0A8J7WIW9_9ACTN|nr:D-alanyl-D-alanine carboxypeptidase [Actinocrinis puniceicyclus]MBS2963136.1 D-alanyl-D-alanine carboxypeptidase [Actinocrinis puniceicyclus]
MGKVGVRRRASGGPSARAVTSRRRRRTRLRFWLVLGLVAAAGGGVGAVFAAPVLAPARVVPEVPDSYLFPGTPPVLPWPASGQAVLAFDGLGQLGASGPVTKAVPIASVAKVLTAYQVLADHPLAPGETGPALTVSREQAASYWGQVAKGESVVPVRAGERITERDALDALLLASADNVAQILARWDAGSVPAFLVRLNRSAAELGITHSTYTDPSGLDAATVSTAPDQLLLAKAAMRIPAFAQLVAQKQAVIPVAGPIRNFNSLLGRDGVVGIKTGSTMAAGGCLMFAADTPAGPGGVTRRLFGVVLGQPGTSTTILPHALAAAGRLVRAAGSVVSAATVLPAGRGVAVVRQAMHADRALAVPADVTVLGWPGLRYSLKVSGPPSAAVLTLRSEAEPDYRVVSRLR